MNAIDPAYVSMQNLICAWYPISSSTKHRHRKTLLAAVALSCCISSAFATRALLDDGYCDWGGHDDPKYPFAIPRTERQWYCDNTALFNSEAQAAADTGTVCLAHTEWSVNPFT